MKIKKFPERKERLIIPFSNYGYVAITTKPIKGKYEKDYVGERKCFNFEPAAQMAFDKKIPLIVVEDEVHCVKMWQETNGTAPCFAYGDTFGMKLMIEELNNFFDGRGYKPNILIIADDKENPISEPKQKKLLNLLRKAGYSAVVW